MTPKHCTIGSCHSIAVGQTQGSPHCFCESDCRTPTNGSWIWSSRELQPLACWRVDKLVVDAVRNDFAHLYNAQSANHDHRVRGESSESGHPPCKSRRSKVLNLCHGGHNQNSGRPRTRSKSSEILAASIRKTSPRSPQIPFRISVSGHPSPHQLHSYPTPCPRRNRIRLLSVDLMLVQTT